MEPRWLTDEEHDAWRNLSIMQFQLQALLGRELADDGLSYQDYLVLVVLSDRPDERERLVELGRALGWEKSRVSHHIARMEKRGLVTKTRCSTDQRGWYVTMSAKGRAAIEAAAPHHVATVRRYFIDLLTPEQIEALDTIARTVLSRLPAAERSDPAPG